MKRRLSRLVASGLGFGVVSLLASCGPRPYNWHGTAYERPPVAPTLTGTFSASTPQSDPTSSSAALGPSLIYFGYTHCPDFCPATLAIVSDMFDGLGDEAEDVRFYFVTVDPERDTPEVLAAYLGAFDSRFVGVRPEPEALPALLSGYGATAFVDPAHSDGDDGFLAHTSRIFLVDQGGFLRVHYPFDTPAADLLADVRQLLRAG